MRHLPVISALVALLGLLTYLLYEIYGSHEQAGGHQGYSLPVRVAPVTEAVWGDVIAAIGTVQANESVMITAREKAHVAALHFDDGMAVQKGQLLIELDAKVATAQLEEVQVRLSEDQRLLTHYQKLLNSRSVSQTQVEEQQARVREGEAKVKAAEALLSNYQVIAPFAGVLGTRQVSQGALVTDDTAIVTLDDITQVKIDFHVPERFLGDLAVGQVIRASSEAYPNDTFSGGVTYVAPRVDPVTRTLTIRALIPNSDSRLRPGMLLHLDLVRNEEPTLIVPEEALIPIKDRSFVFVVGVQERAEQRQVELGRRRPGWIEVQSGLAPADVVIVGGAMKLKTGYPIKVINPLPGQTAQQPKAQAAEG